MALRRSRRLRGLVPEESLLQQVCFICQREIDISSLTRCQRTSCCGVFMHKTCHRQMVTMLPTCGNCRRENDEYQREIVLETDEELESDEENPFEIPIGTTPPPRNTHVVRELIEYRRERRYLNTHYRRSVFWRSYPSRQIRLFGLPIIISWNCLLDCFLTIRCTYTVALCYPSQLRVL